MEVFYGYGNLSSPHWFIGIEEGGSGTLEDLSKRINIWKNSRETCLCVNDFHKKIDQEEYFEGKIKHQLVWSMIIKVLKAINDELISPETIKEFQKEHLGRKDSNHAMLELRPLSCKSMNKWEYSKLDCPILATKKNYLEYIGGKRVDGLRSLLMLHRPRNVFFYSRSIDNVVQWLEISKAEFQEREGFLFGQKDQTNFFIIDHPNKRGVKTEYFLNVGKFCREIINASLA